MRDRLLEKAQSALGPIDCLYERYHGDFKVLFDFPNGATHYSLYQGEGDFEAYYPMVPYQFPLFHLALTGLSDYSMFTGEYQSTGARNMLAATRNALIAAKDTGEVANGDLIPFDALFEGLRAELKSEAFEAISTAEDHFADDGLGVRILKCLLLVKYNDNFVATPQNLRVLLYQSFLEDAVELEERISDTLRRLEAENYVGRLEGESYEYLTKMEKDIETEIKREPVTYTDIRKKIGEVFTKEIVHQTKVTYTNVDFSSTYAYDVRVDGFSVGSSRNALSLNILTDLYDAGRQSYVMAAGIRELVCALPASPRLISEVRLWLQTNSWVSRNLTGEVRRVEKAKTKAVTNSSRWDDIKALMRTLVVGADWATCLTDISNDVRGSGANDRVDAAVRIMVSKSYPMLSLLTGRYDSKSIYKTATGSKLMPGESMPAFVTEVYDEMLRVREVSDRCTVGGSGSNSLESRLGGGQHGWPREAVHQAVAMLACNGRIECLRNDNPLEGANLGRDLSQGRALAEVVVQPARVIDARTLDALRDAHKEICGTTTNEDDARVIVDAVRKDLAEKLTSFSQVAGRAHSFPFSGEYEDLLAKLRVYAAYGNKDLIERLATEYPSIVDVIDGLREMSGFVNGRQGELYLKAVDFLRTQDANIASCRSAARPASTMREILGDPKCYRSGRIPELRRLTREIEGEIKKELAEAKSEAREDLDAFVTNFRSQDYASATDEQKAAADAIINGCYDEIEATTQIQVASGLVDSFKKRRSSELFALVAPIVGGGGGGGEVPPVQPMTVTFDQVGMPDGYKGKTLTTEEDVRQFAYALTRRLVSHIQNNERIVL